MYFHPHLFRVDRTDVRYAVTLLMILSSIFFKDLTKWEKIPSKSKKTHMSRAWFTAKEDSIHIKTMKFCFWCVFCRRRTPRKKRATVFASKPNPRRDLIEFRFYIYSDNRDSSRVSNRLSRSVFWFQAEASTKSRLP